MKLQGIVMALAMSLAVAAPMSAVAGSAEDDVVATCAAWEAAYMSGDIDKLMELYTADAVSMAPGAPASVGKEAIRSDYGKFLADYTVTHQTMATQVAFEGNVAIERGGYKQSATPKKGGPVLYERGKYIVIWNYEADGKWREKLEIWNSDTTEPVTN